MIVQLRLRRGSSAEWESADPVLAEGEPGWDTTANTFKVGDGITPWSGLSYQSYDIETLNAILADVDASEAAAQTAATDAGTAASDAQAAAASINKGVAGGVAALDVDGDVVDADGVKASIVTHTHDLTGYSPTSHTHTENVTRLLHDGTNYPARPAGAEYVEWVGPTQPTASVAGDTWVTTL